MALSWQFSFFRHSGSALVLAGLMAASGLTVAGTYEQPPEVSARTLLPARLFQSGNFRVADEVAVRKHFYRFRVESDLGEYFPESLAMLKIRIHEIRTLTHAMSEFKQDDEKVYQALQGQLHVTGNRVRDIIGSPFETAGKLANQLSRNISTASELATGIATDPGATLYGYDVVEQPGQKKETSRTAVPHDFVFHSHRRNAASQLNLDVYSSNPQVQGFLNTVAEARSRGQLSNNLRAPLVAASNYALSDNPQISMQLRTRLKNLSREELHEFNDQLLRTMGIGKGLREKFLKHPAYSPRHQTVITMHLAMLDKVANRASLIESALEATSEADALFYEMMARKLTAYHFSTRPLARFETLAGAPVAITRDRRLLLVFPVDITYWTPQTEAIINGLLVLANKAGLKSREFLTTGSVTEIARRELERRGFLVDEAGAVH